MTTWRGHLEHRIEEAFEPGDKLTIEWVYELEDEFAQLYPDNQHVQETLRDVLQQLRKDGFIRFEDYEGTYTLLGQPARTKMQAS